MPGAGVIILLQAVGGTSYDPEVVASRVRRVLEEAIGGSVEVVYSIWDFGAPIGAFNWSRKQYSAEEVNRRVYNAYKGFTDEGVMIVSIVEGDGYVDGLNFVFGLATPQFRVASVYTARLKDREKYVERLVKEIVHEIGHLLGLGHCSSDRCVMKFSNSIVEVDYKSEQFCNSCKARLRGLRWP